MLCHLLGVGNQKILAMAAAVAEELGFPAYMVGGPVRDLLLAKWGRLESALPLDLDLVIEGDGVRFAEKLADRLGGKIRVHKRYQTASLELPNGLKVDVATARRERYAYPAASPQIERASIREDLCRRDFSINALAVRLDGEGAGQWVDVSKGKEDLEQGTLRVLHEDSFRDDPSRILRAVRFEQRFNFVVESRTVALMNRAVQEGLVGRLSGPKLFQELTLVLKEREPLKCIRRLDGLGLLKVVHPALSLTPKVAELFDQVRDTLVWYHFACPDKELEAWMVYLMALCEGVSRSGEMPDSVCASCVFESGVFASNVRPPDAGPLDVIRNDARRMAGRLEVQEQKVLEVGERLALPAALAKALKEVALFTALWDILDESSVPEFLGSWSSKASFRKIWTAVEALHASSLPRGGKPLSRGQLGRILRPFSREVLLFLRARALEDRVRDALSLYLVELMEVEPAIRGEDLVRLGLKPGPRYKEILEKTRELKLDGVLRTREDEIRFVRDHYWGGD